MKHLLLPIFLLCASWGLTQNPTPPPKPCATPEYRQMDFWIGDWNVHTPDGKLVGTNRIEQILGSCVLMENWEGAGGSMGHSFNLYNIRTQAWEQTWVDNGGGVIYFQGKWDEEAGNLDFRAESTTRDGKPISYRMVFTPQKDGSVNQVWDASRDGGETWNNLFDGTYKKK